MRTKPLVRLVSFGWLVALMVAWAPWAHAADPDDPTPPVVALGSDTYLITRGAKFFYFRDTAKLVKRARTDAQFLGDPAWHRERYVRLREAQS